MSISIYTFVNLKTSYNMKNITIIIEHSNNFYWAYAENVEGISAGGETVQEAKNGIFEAIALQKELGNFLYNNYQLTYKYDTESLLQYFKGIISNPAFERLTGCGAKKTSYSSTSKNTRRVA